MRTYRRIIKDSSFLPLSLYEMNSLNHLCDAAKRLDNRNAIPATSSNFSVRAKDNNFFITKSGLHKRNLKPNHFIRVHLNGKPVHPLSPKPSDETLLHALIYKNFSQAQAILHCHAPELEFVNLEKSQIVKPVHEATNISDIKFGFFKLEGHEILKALGFKSHLEHYYLPVIENNQNMEKLSTIIEQNFFAYQQKLPYCAFLLEKHGIYCFGNSVHQAELRLEAILHLLTTLK
ncbi:methylthioribulose 1-phosphate dehydratase [Silvanigrella aquatica]|uniref:Methylthioribulose 1-phosphate dehydratase n=1 Tax=Silvanigrella aquatica TaxID=1915309 RepID=A0A1L4CYJ1_9BACT|nr:methylthioribulose 1-phosphate dehydratase [Silvanigrella aquatica]APJ03016.1 methylthioribulose-1-phosphate dehydratase [Silvanigrella aquatica]